MINVIVSIYIKEKYKVESKNYHHILLSPGANTIVVDWRISRVLLPESGLPV